MVRREEKIPALVLSRDLSNDRGVLGLLTARRGQLAP